MPEHLDHARQTVQTMAFQLRITVRSTGPGRWTDCVSIAAESVAKAVERATVIVAQTLPGNNGSAALYDVVGRLVWQSDVHGDVPPSSDVESADKASSIEQA